MAIVELKENQIILEEEIIDYCKQWTRYEKPIKIIFEKIIRNRLGKIDKKTLKEKYLKLCYEEK